MTASRVDSNQPMKAFELLQGDCLQQLATLPAASVQCCVTSPPYWGLRDYGTPGQLGLEATPDEYVANMVAVFRAVRRVLRDDGTLWLNLGDSYAGNSNNTRGEGAGGGKERGKAMGFGTLPQKKDYDGIKPKDLVGIPWRVAFALQADGWYLRQDIIWHKPNPMPESVTDRCTKAHEYIFLLTKSARYFYDSDAVKEPVSEVSLKRAEYGWDCDRPSTKNASMGGDGIHTEKMGTRFVNPTGRNKRSVWTISTKPYRGAHFATFPPDLIEPCILAGSATDALVLDPFSGAGTTGVVSVQHGRRYIGIELNPDYLEMSRKRIQLARDSITTPLF